jgi:hypothetical protein
LSVNHQRGLSWRTLLISNCSLNIVSNSLLKSHKGQLFNHSSLIQSSSSLQNL